MSKLKNDNQRARDAQLAEWLRVGIAKTGKKKSDLAKALGLDAGAISKLLGGSREFKESEILQIAEFLGMPPPSLSESISSRIVEVRPVGWATPTVVIAPGVWREKGLAVNVSERIPLSVDTRLEGVAQYVCKLESSGEYAVCVPFTTFRKTPLVGDTLHVRRNRGDLAEDTLRRVTGFAGSPMTVAHGSSDAPSPLVEDETTELVGLVVGYFSPVHIGPV